MDTENTPPRRENMLSILLTGMAAMFFLAYLILITGGWFFWLVLVLGGMIAFMWLNYLLWGKRLSDEVAGEREEEELRRRAEANDSEKY